MPSLEEYLQKADKLAQDVVNAWGANVQAGNADTLRAEFKGLLDKACRFRDARSLADNRRTRNSLTEEVAAEEREARQAFAEAYNKLSHWESSDGPYDASRKPPVCAGKQRAPI